MNDGPGSVTKLMQDGGEEAFWQLYVRYVVENEPLQRQVRKRLASDRVAEPIDILGDAFRQVWERAISGKFKVFEGRENLLALLTTYARSKACDARRKRRPIGESSCAADGPGADPVASDQRLPQPTEEELRVARDEVDALMARLPDDELRRVARSEMEGKSHAEIAQELGYSNVKRVERALETIRRCWMADHLEAFERAWKEASDSIPAFERHYLQFPEGGRWFLRDLVDIEIHERLKRGLPVVLGDFESRVATPEERHQIAMTFKQNLFFHASPSPELLERLLATLDPAIADVVRCKWSGMKNEEIQRLMKWPLSSIKDALVHARECLESLVS